MPKIPDINTINWGASITEFLTQLLDPETGSINLWNDETRPGGLIGIAGVKQGKSGWNISKGCLEVFDGSKWIQLKSSITEIPTPLLTSNNNTIANTEWVTKRIDKVIQDFTSNILDNYINTKVKEIVRDEIIPEVNFIMETYRTIHEISGYRSSVPVEPEIRISSNKDNNNTYDVHISFDESSLAPVGIYVSQEKNIWMGYDRFLSKDLVNNTLVTTIKGQQGLFYKSGTLQGVELEPSWVLHLITNPTVITPNTFESQIITIIHTPLSSVDLYV
jgi:hypothetical protein